MKFVWLALLAILGYQVFFQNRSVTSVTPIKTEKLSKNSTLPAEVQGALEAAIKDEYKAEATYRAIIKKFGSTRPFSNIVLAEGQHIGSLTNLYVTYGLQIPDNKEIVEVSGLTRLSDACKAGVTAEKANVELYKSKLIPLAENYPDIKIVFEQLMWASEARHLPAFERCQ